MRRSNFRTQQHSPGSFQRDLHLYGELFPGLLHGVENARQRGLRLQQILTGFNQKNVYAALDQRQRLLFESRRHVVKSNVPQRRQLGRRPHGSRYKPGSIRSRKLTRHFDGQPSGRDVDFRRPVLQAVLRQHRARRAKRVGLHHVAANPQKRSVNISNQIRTTENQNLVAAFVPPKVIDGGLANLHTGAHRPVVDDDALLQSF